MKKLQINHHFPIKILFPSENYVKIESNYLYKNIFPSKKSQKRNNHRVPSNKTHLFHLSQTTPEASLYAPFRKSAQISNSDRLINELIKLLRRAAVAG